MYRRCKSGRKPTLLDEVLWNRDVDRIQTLLDGVDLNARIKSLGTLLHIAARNFPVEIIDKLLYQNSIPAELSKRLEATERSAKRAADVVDLLLKRGADVNARDQFQSTPLHEATMVHSLSILFARYFGVDETELPRQAELSLGPAFIESAVRCINLLLTSGADVNAVDAHGYTPLCAAIMRGSLYESPDGIRLLLDHGADVNVQGNPVRDTALHGAAWRGSLVVVKMLLEHGANVDAVNKNGETPLINAVRGWCSLDMVKTLLEHGTSVNVEDKFGITPLPIASHSDSPHVVKALLERGANVDAADKTGRTAVHLAAEGRSLECMRLLLEHGALVNVANESGQTPLHIAASRASVDMVKMLLERGASVDPEDNRKQTPLHRAVKNYIPSNVKLLLEHGANLNARDNAGFTPLFLAVRRDSSDARKRRHSIPFDTPSISKMLIGHGADVNTAYKDGETLLHFAARNCSTELIEVLLERGANVNVLGDFADTPLHLLFESPEPLKHIQRAMSILLKHGTDLQCENTCGRNPVHQFFVYRSSENSDLPTMFDIITELISHGADFTAKMDDVTSCIMMMELEEYVPASRKDIVVDRINKLIALIAVEMGKKNRPLFCEIAISMKKSWNKAMLKSKTKSRKNQMTESSVDYYDKCVLEVNKLKTIRLIRDITLGDVLILGDPVTMAKISGNIHFREYVESKELINNFPVYSFLIRYQYRRSWKLKLLCEKCEISLGILFSRKLNRDCAYEILGYLSEIDMRYLNEATTDV